MIERIAQGAFDQALGVGRRQPLLGLALELRLADEHRDQHRGVGDDVFGRDQPAALLVDELGIGLEAPRQGGPEARFVGAPFRSGHGVAVGLDEAVRLAEAGAAPGQGPFHRLRPARAFDAAAEGFRRHRLDAGQPLGQEIGQPIGEVENGRLGRVAGQLLGARPADLHAPEQIGLGPRHAVEPRGLEGDVLAEDRRVGPEADGGAAFSGWAHLLELPHGLAPGEGLAPLMAVLPDDRLQPLGEGVDHRDADAMQAAGGLVALARELPARVQGGHDHFQGRLGPVLRMGVDGDAAAIVADVEPASGIQGHLDQLGVAGDGLVHGVVQHFGEQVMLGPVVCAAHVHAWTPAHGLQPLQDLDVLGGVAAAAGARARLMGLGERPGRGGRQRFVEQVQGLGRRLGLRLGHEGTVR